MVSTQRLYPAVGIFLVGAVLALLVLALKVSGLTLAFNNNYYQVSANFDDLGSLKIKAPVKIAGVRVGEVGAISLDPVTFRATVVMYINAAYNKIPKDSSASILTSGLLGDNYIALVPMYDSEFLHNGSIITYTHSALVLEQLLGRLLYKSGS